MNQKNFYLDDFEDLDLDKEIDLANEEFEEFYKTLDENYFIKEDTSFYSKCLSLTLNEEDELSLKDISLNDSIIKYNLNELLSPVSSNSIQVIEKPMSYNYNDLYKILKIISQKNNSCNINLQEDSITIENNSVDISSFIKEEFNKELFTNDISLSTLYEGEKLNKLKLKFKKGKKKVDDKIDKKMEEEEEKEKKDKEDEEELELHKDLKKDENIKKKTKFKFLKNKLNKLISVIYGLNEDDIKAGSHIKLFTKCFARFMIMVGFVTIIPGAGGFLATLFKSFVAVVVNKFIKAEVGNKDKERLMQTFENKISYIQNKMENAKNDEEKYEYQKILTELKRNHAKLAGFNPKGSVT